MFETYSFRQYLSNPAQTQAAYAENATRILDMRSNIKLDKLGQAVKGGFAGTTNVTDISGKTFSNMIFDYSSQNSITRSPSPTAFSPNKTFSIGSLTTPTKSLSDLSSASISNISTNSNSNYNGNPNSTTGPTANNISRAKSYYANLEAVSHQIQVYGDFSLNPGRKIRIVVPKAINVDEYRGNINPDTEELDKSLSGEYLVAVVSHDFKAGIYTSKVKIIKDS